MQESENRSSMHGRASMSRSLLCSLQRLFRGANANGVGEQYALASWLSSESLLKFSYELQAALPTSIPHEKIENFSLLSTHP